MKRILIASCSFDRDAVKPVVDSLRARGYNCLIYESDMVVSGKAAFALTIGAKAGITFSYEGTSYHPDEIDAAWHRQPGLVGLEIPDKGKQLSLSYEMRNLQGGLWRLVADTKWLNAPSLMSAVDNKLLHLTLAREVGFAIPDTVVSNSWDVIRSTLPANIIMKLPRGLLYINNEARSTSTDSTYGSKKI